MQKTVDYLPIRQSQICQYVKTPLYIKNRDGAFTLYKSADREIDLARFSNDSHPQLYITEDNKEFALNEVQSQLIKKLKDRIKSGDLLTIKNALFEIVNDAFNEPIGEEFKILPQTIDILYDNFSLPSKLLKLIEGMQFGNSTLVEHSVNVMVLVLNFCIFCRIDENEAKNLSLSALLHDVGLTKVPPILIEAKRKLSDKEFEIFKSHPLIGHDIIVENDHVDSIISIGVLEHHERLDGSGYPRGISNLSFNGGLIGILDSFDSLTCTEKLHRKKENPFGALRIVQEEIMADGKFDKTIFRDICLSLIGKRQYSGA